MFEIALTVVLVMAVAGSLAVVGSRVAGWITLGAAVVWPFVNRRIEGPVLLVIGQGHGLTVSDLLAPAGVVLSVLALTGWLHRSARGGNVGGRVVSNPDPGRSDSTKSVRASGAHGGQQGT